MMLNLNSNSYNNNCQLDCDTILLEEDIILSQFTTSTSYDIPLNEMEKENIDIENENIQLEIYNKLAVLSMSTCSLKMCIIEYLVGYIVKKSTEIFK